MGSVGHTGSSSDGLASRMLQTGLLIDKYYTPLLCLFGALGNSLSLAVFCFDSKYRSQSSSYYLSALAVSDTGFLLNLFAVWLETVHGGVITSDLMCPLVMYLGQVTCFMSIYLTVAFSIERYVAVHYPFSRPRICTRSKAKKGILALTMIALLIFSYAWIIAKVIEIKPLSVDSHQHQNESQQQSKAIAEKAETTNHSLYRDPINRQNNDVQISEAETENQDIKELTPFIDKEDYIGENMRRRMTSTNPNTDPTFRQMRSEEKGNWLYNRNNGNRSIKVSHRETSEKKEQMRQKWDYFHLIDDNGIIEENEREENMLQYDHNDKNTDPPYSLGDPSSNELFPEQPQTFTTSFPSITSKHDLNRNLKSGIRRRYRCTVPKHYFKISEIANYLDTAVTLIVPFLLITYFNVRISISVWKLKDQRQQIVASPSTNRSTMLVVTDNRQRSRHSPPTNIVNTHLLQPHQHHSTVGNGIRNHHFQDNIDENNGACHWKLQQHTRDASCVRFEDISTGICRYTATSTLKKNGTETTLNEVHRGSFEAAKPILRRSGNNSTIVKRDFSIFRRGEPRAVYHHPSSEVRVTKTLLLVSSVFLVLNLPLHAIRCTQFIQSVTGTQEGKDILRALQPWANILFNTNFAVNFLLYCASGRNFRKSLKHIASRALRKTPQRLALKSSSHHHKNHYTRRLGGQNIKKKQNWRRRRSSTPERTGTKNISNCCGDPSLTTVVKCPQATELFEFEDTVGTRRIEEGSMHLADNENEESVTG